MHADTTRLKQARIDAGWSQKQLASAMMRAASRLGITLPSLATLKTNIRRWESGQVIPGEEYRRILGMALGLSDAALGFASADIHVPQDHDGQALTPDGVRHLGTLLPAHIAADNLLGPRSVVQLVAQEAHLLSRAVRDARGVDRQRALETAVRFHEFLGWLEQDCGRHKDAMASTDRARDFAVELRDPLTDAYLLMRKSNIASDAGDPMMAVALADAALATAPAGSPRVHAVLHRQKANAEAALGDTSQCARALERSMAAVRRAPDEGDQLAGYCNEQYIAMEAASCWTRLGQPKRAVDALRQVGTELLPVNRRDNGLFLARAAMANAGIDDIERACNLAEQAASIARSTGSVRTIAELRRLHAHPAMSGIRGVEAIDASYR